ncbi:hypothetical protein [Streptomyces canarius]
MSPAYTVRVAEDPADREACFAVRKEVLAARSEPGADPEIVDRVLRHLDVRSLR